MYVLFNLWIKMIVMVYRPSGYNKRMNSLHLEIPLLRRFINDHPSLVVLSGAGISASSGIPTYRDRSGVWRHSKPITHQEFTTDANQRRRYWARSLRGWPAVRDARPNAAHLALSRLERLGHIDLLITQNVDRLHQRAGSTAVVDLHGRVDQVRCLVCSATFSREHIQMRLLRDNPRHSEVVRAPQQQARPDGDADIPGSALGNFAAPSCDACDGDLIPDVVFFGGTVPRTRVEQCAQAIEKADALLAVGSSLQVYSGFRFCRQAAKLGKPLIIINPGATRADSLASAKFLTESEALLTALVAGLDPVSGAPLLA